MPKEKVELGGFAKSWNIPPEIFKVTSEQMDNFSKKLQGQTFQQIISSAKSFSGFTFSDVRMWECFRLPNRGSSTEVFIKTFTHTDGSGKCCLVGSTDEFLVKSDERVRRGIYPEVEEGESELLSEKARKFFTRFNGAVSLAENSAPTNYFIETMPDDSNFAPCQRTVSVNGEMSAFFEVVGDTCVVKTWRSKKSRRGKALDFFQDVLDSRTEPTFMSVKEKRCLVCNIKIEGDECEFCSP